MKPITDSEMHEAVRRSAENMRRLTEEEEKRKPIYVECPECKGECQEERAAGHPNDPAGRTVMQDCGYCRGMGEVTEGERDEWLDEMAAREAAEHAPHPDDWEPDNNRTLGLKS